MQGAAPRSFGTLVFLTRRCHRQLGGVCGYETNHSNKIQAAINAAEPTFELNNRAYVLLQIMVAHDEFNSPEEAARYCTAGAVASLIESMKEDETLEIFGCEKDGAK